MFQLLESIKITDGTIQNLDYHIQRMNHASQQLWNQSQHCVDFEHINQTIKANSSKQTIKLRIVYNADGFEFSLQPYTLKSIQTLMLLENPNIDYSYKYEDRTAILEMLTQRESCDDVLITREGAITDSSYCNVAFLRKNNWYTPDLPLLEGTKRAFLIDSGLIKTSEIYVEDIPDFEKIRLFNSMIEFGEVELPTSHIHIS